MGEEIHRSKAEIVRRVAEIERVDMALDEAIMANDLMELRLLQLQRCIDQQQQQQQQESQENELEEEEATGSRNFEWALDQVAETVTVLVGACRIGAPMQEHPTA